MRFPRYFVVFSTLSFNYHGVDIRNHNSLLGRVEGVDGIKTGYTDASGYNLVSSVHRTDKSLVAVVLGETSNSARDARMRTLIEDCMRTASAPHAATTISQAPGRASAGAAGPEPARGFVPASTGSRPARGMMR